MTQNKKSRREFLNHGLAFGAASFLSPHQIFLNSLCRGLIQDARAEELNNVSAMNYVSIDVPGAPNRFVFDQWLRTNDDDPQLIFNPMTATKYKNKSPQGINQDQAAADLEYATFKYNGLNVPYLFSQMISTSQGSQSLSRILDNMLVVRGFASGLDGHQLNANKMTLPVGGLPSISGLNSDQQKKIFDAIQWPDRNIRSTYYSEKGRPLIALRGGNPLGDLLNSFKRQNVASELHRIQDTRKPAMDLALERLAGFARSGNAGSKRIQTDFVSAKKLIQGGLADFDGFYGPAVQKYRNIVLGAMRTINIEGISDFALVSPFSTHVSGPWSITIDSDLDSVLRTNYDFRQAIQSAEIAFLPEIFAVAEFLLNQKLCSSIELQIGGSTMMDLPYINGSGTSFDTKRVGAANDMHVTGAYTSLAITNSIYRGILSGLAEFIIALKGKKYDATNTVWDKTVVQLFSEFGRSTRTNASGADHGYNSMATSFFTGSVNDGPYVMGNIRTMGIDSNYIGTHGLAAPIVDHNEALPSPIAVASTLSELLRAEKNPYVNLARPLGKFVNGKWTVNQKAKLVPG